jgi:hypothetical protein
MPLDDTADTPLPAVSRPVEVGHRCEAGEDLLATLGVPGADDDPRPAAHERFVRHRREGREGAPIRPTPIRKRSRNTLRPPRMKSATDPLKGVTLSAGHPARPKCDHTTRPSGRARAARKVIRVVDCPAAAASEVVSIDHNPVVPGKAVDVVKRVVARRHVIVPTPTAHVVHAGARGSRSLPALPT